MVLARLPAAQPKAMAERSGSLNLFLAAAYSPIPARQPKGEAISAHSTGERASPALREENTIIVTSTPIIVPTTPPISPAEPLERLAIRVLALIKSFCMSLYTP